MIIRAIKKARNKKLLWLLLVVFQILGILSAMHAVMSVRTPQGTIAWVASLITVPPVAVPAYWVFGRNKFRGYVLAHERELANLESIIRQANSQITGYPALPGHPDSCGTE